MFESVLATARLVTRRIGETGLVGLLIGSMVFVGSSTISKPADATVYYGCCAYVIDNFSLCYTPATLNCPVGLQCKYMTETRGLYVKVFCNDDEDDVNACSGPPSGVPKLFADARGNVIAAYGSLVPCDALVQCFEDLVYVHTATLLTPGLGCPTDPQAAGCSVFSGDVCWDNVFPDEICIDCANTICCGHG